MAFGGGGTPFVDPYGRLFGLFAVVPQKMHHHLDHRGDEVTSGRKYVLRSDVMYSPRAADLSVAATATAIWDIPAVTKTLSQP
jgi:hypothetical protein